VSDTRSLGRRRLVRALILTVALVALAAVPLYVDGSWLLVGILAMAAAVGAIGLTILVGTAGQLSLAHAFFVACGAYAYAFFAGESSSSGVSGLGWPSPIAAIAAIGVASLAGLAFSPVAARVRGLYLGVASLGLVFIGQHLLRNLVAVTGGSNGRNVPPLEVFGFELTGTDPDLHLFGVPLGDQERLWYVLLVALLIAIYVATGIVRRRPGRAFTLVRDNEAAASALGIHVQSSKATAFVLSSAFAGASGVLTAVAFGYVVPQYFGLVLSINFLVMVIVGGLGSIGGAVAGAFIVTALPLILDRMAQGSGLLAAPGSGGYDASTISTIVFGALTVVVIIVEPGGLAQLWRRGVARLVSRTPRTAQHVRVTPTA
jgi:branched-chain amino acid transport system permease protein